MRTIDSKFEKYDAEGACAAFAGRLPASSLSILTYPVVSRVAIHDRRLRRVCAKQTRRGRLATTAASVYGERRKKTGELVEYYTCRSGEEGCCIEICAISLVIDLIGFPRRPGLSSESVLRFEGDARQARGWLAGGSRDWMAISQGDKKMASRRSLHRQCVADKTAVLRGLTSTLGRAEQFKEADWIVGWRSVSRTRWTRSCEGGSPRISLAMPATSQGLRLAGSLCLPPPRWKSIPAESSLRH